MGERLIPKNAVRGLAAVTLVASAALFYREHTEQVTFSKWLLWDKSVALEVAPDHFNIVTATNRYTFPGQFNEFWQGTYKDFYSVGSQQGKECFMSIIEPSGAITTIHDKGINGYRVFAVSDTTIRYYNFNGYSMTFKTYDKITHATTVDGMYVIPYYGGYMSSKYEKDC
jgi:hypothetical protein